MRRLLASLWFLAWASAAYAGGDCSSTVTTGGLAQSIFTAAQLPYVHSWMLGNIDTAAGSGEPLWFSLTGTAAAGAAGSWPLSAPTATTFASLTTFTTPLNLGLSSGANGPTIIAATTGHKYSCTYW